MELIAALAERFADQSIRFDTGFDGAGRDPAAAGPVLARGRIGRRFFIFRYRGDDSVTLTIGSPTHRSSASRAKHSRRKALRALRRSNDIDLRGTLFFRGDLKRNTILDRHPSRAVWYACIDDVTGSPYGGSLEAEDAAELFIELMSRLQLAEQKPQRIKYDAIRRGSCMPPMPKRRSVIRKAQMARR
jgi:hypothetical protein